MSSRPLPRRQAADWPARAIPSGLVAAIAMLLTFFVVYALAALFAGIKANSAAGAQVMQGWFRAATHNPLVDPGGSAVYAVGAVELGLALLGAALFAAFEPRWPLPKWARGPSLATALWFVSVLVVLPAAGGGFLGVGLGAGPLPMLGLLLVWLGYGLAFSAVYTPALAEPALAPAAAIPLVGLQVIAVNGACLQGYRVGDRFSCTMAGDVSPRLCPEAVQALRPTLAAMAQRRPNAPRTVACPIEEHMLVFQLDGAAV